MFVGRRKMMTHSKRMLLPCVVLFIIVLVPALFVLKLLVGRGFADNIFHQTAVILDVSKPQTIVLRKRFYQGSIDMMRVHCSGFLEGKAKIQRILYNGDICEGPYNEENLNGKVSFSWGGDWYSDTAEIRYIPDSVTAGKLTLTYSFYD